MSYFENEINTVYCSLHFALKKQTGRLLGFSLCTLDEIGIEGKEGEKEARKGGREGGLEGKRE